MDSGLEQAFLEERSDTVSYKSTVMKLVLIIVIYRCNL